MTDDPAPRYSKLHPAIAAALERDDIPLSRIADLVGLDERTVSRLRLDGVTEERAARYRALDAWIEGRARAVRRDGAWELDALAQSVPAADIDRAAQELATVAARLETEAAMVRALIQIIVPRTAERDTNAQPRDLIGQPNFPRKCYTNDLPADGAGSSITVMLDAQSLKQVAADVWKRSRTEGMVSLHKKVPRDHVERLEAAANAAGMDPSDFLRGLLESCLPPKVAG